MANERLDFVVFGATGFTGKYAIAEVHRVSKNFGPFSWAVAGRSRVKLDEALWDLQQETGDDLSGIRAIVADVTDPASLNRMTAQAKVVINCCGPYRFYGEPVVKSCIKTKTNHVDVSGEPAYMEKMQLKYHEDAERAGVYVVSACGFDSIPAEMGIIYLEKNFKGQVNSAEAYLTINSTKPKMQSNAAFHYATWESLIHGIASMKELGPLRRRLFSARLPPFLPKIIRRFVIHRSDAAGRWCLPFAGSDAPCVYRSQRYLYEAEAKRPVQMRAYFVFPSFAAAFKALCAMLAIGALGRFAFARRLLLKYPERFSFGLFTRDGPTRDDADHTKFSMLICGEGWHERDDVERTPPAKKMTVKVSGMNPGYGAACTCVVFAAVAILKESHKMPGRGGVLAPGAAFRNTSLIENLQKNNIEFSMVREKSKL